jgi:hypothetical protein
MLEKVCAYACNYARDGVVHQYCLGLIKFVVQITLKWNINKRSNYISACSKQFNIFFFCNLSFAHLCLDQVNFIYIQVA